MFLEFSAFADRSAGRAELREAEGTAERERHEDEHCGRVDDG